MSEADKPDDVNDIPMCWFCQDTGTMSILVNKEGHPVSTTSEGWPPDFDFKKHGIHWKQVPCEHCETIRKPWK